MLVSYPSTRLPARPSLYYSYCFFLPSSYDGLTTEGLCYQGSTRHVTQAFYSTLGRRGFISSLIQQLELGKQWCIYHKDAGDAPRNGLSISYEYR